MSLTPEAKRRMLRMETYATFPFLIEVTHDNTVYRYANSEESITYENHVFSPACFSISPPSKSENEVSDGKLSFSVIDQVWIEKIRNTTVAPTIRFLAVIVYDQTNTKHVEAIEDMSFTLSSPTWNDLTMTFTMKYENRMSLRVPVDVCNSRTTPAVV